MDGEDMTFRKEKKKEGMIQTVLTIIHPNLL